MCQVGVRCFADSNAKLQAETKRLNSVDAQLAEVESDIQAAAKTNDFTAYSTARQAKKLLQSKREKIVAERNSAQRDVDGTKKGQAALDQAMLEADSYAEFEKLKERKAQGNSTAFVRAYSAQYNRSGKTPTLFLPGDVKPKALKSA